MRVVEEFPTEPSADSTNAKHPPRFVLRGVLPGDATALDLDGTRWVLGRGGESDVVLGRARVSRSHAEITRRGPVIAIRDLKSTNGTHVNGESVEHASLGAGSVVRIGEWLGVVEEVAYGMPEWPFGELAPGIWGSALLGQSLRLLKLAAASRLPVLLVGNTGTGKERLARALHHFSGDERPFRAINCAALQPALAEAELFGYRKGSFTGADRSFAGHLRLAEDGILFLDEVADLPASVQAKLLRALDTGEFTPLGEATVARLAARVVAACQQPLSELVARGRFRADLAARLAGVIVEIPELVQRRADIPSLFDRFLCEHSGATAPPVSTRLHEHLCLHDWPGNVRELELLARQLLATHGMEPLLRRSHLPKAMHPLTTDTRIDGASPRSNSADVACLTNALKQVGGNVKVAAKMAGISRQRAYRLIGSRRLTSLVAESRQASDEDDVRDA